MRCERLYGKMQVFLPYSNYAKSVAALNDARLGNQCYRECLTIFRGKWPHHPASKMWLPFKRELAKYAYACAIEMATRNKWRPQIVDKWQSFWSQQIAANKSTGKPSWIGNEKLHSSHRGVLSAKFLCDKQYALLIEHAGSRKIAKQILASYNLPSKAQWTRSHFETVCDIVGKRASITVEWFEKPLFRTSDGWPYHWPI